MLEALISAIILIGLGIAIYQIRKKNPSLRIGDAVNKIIILDHVSIFVMIMIIANVAEALWAASIHPDNQSHINSVTRFTGHLVISALSITTGIMVSVYIKKMIIGEMKWSFSYALLLMISAFLAFSLPIMNLFIIAGGLGQAKLLYYTFFYPLDGFSRMEYGLQASLVLTATHLAALILDIIYIVATGKGFNDPIPIKIDEAEAVDVTKDGDKNKKKNSNRPDMEHMLAELLDFIGENKNNRTALAADKIRNLSTNDTYTQATLLNNLNRLYERYLNYKAKEDNYPEIEVRTLKEDIYNFWSGSFSTGKGLGMPLKTT